MAKLEITEEAAHLIEVFAVVYSAVLTFRILARPGVGKSFVNVAERAFNLKFVKTK